MTSPAIYVPAAVPLSPDLCASVCSLPHAAAVSDPHGRLLFANTMFGEIFMQHMNGVSDTQNVIEILQSISAVDRRSNTSVLGELSTKAVSNRLRLECITGRTLQATVYPVVPSSDDLRIWEIVDVSDAQRLQKHEAYADKMNAVSRFAGGIAHEFNNLLTTVLGNLELIRMSQRTDFSDVPSKVDAAEAAALRAGGLIHQLRRFSARTPLTMQVQPIAPILRQVYRIVSGMAAAGISVALHIDHEDETLQAAVSQEDLTDVLLKIATNALEAIRDGHGSVELSVSAVNSSPDEESVLRISVTDSGAGMNQSVQELAFEPFFTTKNPTESAGLGMAVAYSLVDEMDGHIEIESAPDDGTVVTILLPLQRREVNKEERGVPATEVTVRSRKIAVVDNEAGIRSVGQGMLRHLGHSVDVFASGPELLAALESKIAFDLIILDDGMPQMSGRSTYAKIRENHTDLPVIICSGRNVNLKTFASGDLPPPSGFLAKPFSLANLVAILDKVH